MHTAGKHGHEQRAALTWLRLAHVRIFSRCKMYHVASRRHHACIAGPCSTCTAPATPAPLPTPASASAAVPAPSPSPKVAVLTGLSSIPWMIKPLYGFLSDAVPLFGYRRRSYLVLCGLVGASRSKHTSTLPKHSVLSCP